MSILPITDLDLPTLSPYARLTDKELRSKQDPARAVFLAESRTVVTLALDAGYTPVSFLIETHQLRESAADLVERITTLYPNIPIYTADNTLLSGLTGFALSRGVLGLFHRPVLPTVEAVCQHARRIAVLEDIMDATNVGAIFRSAAALGIDAVLISPRCSDPLLRRSARVSMGTVCLIPWTICPDWHDTGIDTLHSLGFATAAMALSHNTVDIDDPTLCNETRLAILLGTEGTGLSPETIQRSDYTVKIPMYHGVDSLNVAAASAVAFWELCRGKK